MKVSYKIVTQTICCKHYSLQTSWFHFSLLYFSKYCTLTAHSCVPVQPIFISVVMFTHLLLLLRLERCCHNQQNRLPELWKYKHSCNKAYFSLLIVDSFQTTFTSIFTIKIISSCGNTCCWVCMSLSHLCDLDSPPKLRFFLNGSLAQTNSRNTNFKHALHKTRTLKLCKGVSLFHDDATLCSSQARKLNTFSTQPKPNQFNVCPL